MEYEFCIVNTTTVKQGIKVTPDELKYMTKLANMHNLSVR